MGKENGYEMSPTCVSAARRFFFGGSCTTSADVSAAAPEAFCDDPSGGSVSAGMLSSMLAAGVSGGSALRFIGTTGVTKGDIVGRPTVDSEGVDRGVAIDELVRGSEWWCAMDCSCSVCCCVWCTVRISSKTTSVQ